MNVSRRHLLASIGGATIGAMISRPAHSYPLGLQPGMQIFSVRDSLKKDVPGTLRELARIGFRELEIFKLPPSPGDFKKQCDDAGLRVVSGHFYLHALDDQKTIEAAQLLGMQYVVVVFPELRSLQGKDKSSLSDEEVESLYDNISLDDYRWDAEQFNLYGERLKRQGLKLAYHNHALELKRFEGGKTGLDELISATQPGLVTFELDTGHVIHAGGDPIHYLEKFPTRIELLHLKDLKPGFGISARLDTEEMDTNAELGSGVIDWRRLFAVAARGNVKHWFIEHEGAMGSPQLNMSALEHSLRYLQRL